MSHEDPKYDPVGKLIQLAGKREHVDALRAARVRATVHAQWQDSVQSNRPRRPNWAWIAMASAAVVVAGFGLRMWLAPPGNLPGGLTMPRVVAISGEAWVGEVRLATGDTIPLLSAILTGPAGRVALELNHGA
ncbi:MAG: hypothetical protein O7D35_02935, partial [Acidobacteria bacterium]|nr:hypothetical protein [Acidobacteriota bacterium]